MKLLLLIASITLLSVTPLTAEQQKEQPKPQAAPQVDDVTQDAAPFIWERGVGGKKGTGRSISITASEIVQALGLLGEQGTKVRIRYTKSDGSTISATRSVGSTPFTLKNATKIIRVDVLTA
jgi:hypothetical protein